MDVLRPAGKLDLYGKHKDHHSIRMLAYFQNSRLALRRSLMMTARC